MSQYRFKEWKNLRSGVTNSFQSIYLQWKYISVLNLEKDQMRIQSPTNGEDYYLIQETSKSLIKRYEDGSKMIKMCLIVFGSVGLVIGAYAGWKYYKKWCTHRSAPGADRDEFRQIWYSRNLFLAWNKIICSSS